MAYCQEVQGYLSGITDYSLLKGDTGPLVCMLFCIVQEGNNVHGNASFIQFILQTLLDLSTFLMDSID